MDLSPATVADFAEKAMPLFELKRATTSPAALTACEPLVLDGEPLVYEHDSTLQTLLVMAKYRDFWSLSDEDFARRLLPFIGPCTEFQGDPTALERLYPQVLAWVGHFRSPADCTPIIATVVAKGETLMRFPRPVLPEALHLKGAVTWDRINARLVYVVPRDQVESLKVSGYFERMRVETAPLDSMDLSSAEWEAALRLWEPSSGELTSLSGTLGVSKSLVSS